jgi:threonine aldolase
VGSLLLGNAGFIKGLGLEKVFWGWNAPGWICAAIGIYALENNIKGWRQTIAIQKTEAELAKKPFTDTILPVETNIVIASFKPPFTPQQFVDAMKKEGILLFTISPTQVRIVLHLDITAEMVSKTISAIKNL